MLLAALLVPGALLPDSGGVRARSSRSSPTNPKIGVHTRLTDEVEPWKIQRSLRWCARWALAWVVEYFLWAAARAAPGVYDWTHADLVVDHAVNQGLTVIARLGYVPEWARPPRRPARCTWTRAATMPLPASRRPSPPISGPRALHHHLERAEPEPGVGLPAGRSGRLHGDAAPGLPGSQGGQSRRAGAGRRAGAHPGAARQRMGLERSGSTCRRCMTRAPRPYFDLLAVHAYGWSFAADEPASPDAVNFRRVELLREIMVRNGDGAKHMMITEGGWNDHPRWTKAVRPPQRVTIHDPRLRAGAGDWPWVDALCIWAFRYPAAGGHLPGLLHLRRPRLPAQADLPRRAELRAGASPGSHETASLCNQVRVVLRFAVAALAAWRSLVVSVAGLVGLAVAAGLAITIRRWQQRAGERRVAGGAGPQLSRRFENLDPATRQAGRASMWTWPQAIAAPLGRAG